MLTTIHYGLRRMQLEVADGSLLPAPPLPAPLDDPGAAVRAALEQPHDFPALRRALTPDDRVVVVVDERLPGLADLLVPVLEHVASASVEPSAITLLCPSGEGNHPWWEHLPEPWRGLTLEVHHPAGREHVAYLATTSAGKRLYLNRTLVDAAQSIILSGCRYDLLLGRSGGEGALYPALGDVETLREMARKVRFQDAGSEPWPLDREAREVAWLIGQPFYIEVISGPGDSLASVVAGAGDAVREAQRRLDATWRHTLPRRADNVVVSLRGDPDGHTWDDLAAALATATRVVRPDGRIVLLTAASPELDPAFEILREEDDPRDALRELQKHPTLETAAALRWVQAACHARLAVWSHLDEYLVEELYATPLTARDEVQRLLDAGGMTIVLEDAHKMSLTVARGGD
jgi:hypothetical protein